MTRIIKVIKLFQEKKKIIKHINAEFSEVHKKEDPNDKETALSEIKIDETEGPAGKNEKKAFDNLAEEMSDLPEAEELSAEDDLTQDPFPDQEQDQDEGDSDPEIRKLEGKSFSIRKSILKMSFQLQVPNSSTLGRRLSEPTQRT